MRFLYLILFIGSFFSCGIQPKDFSSASNIVVAHRGAWKHKDLPQNSIASLKEAIALGCTGSEFDVRMTLDSVLVVHHDPDYHNLIIKESNYAELLGFQLSNGEKLPTLKEYLKAGKVDNSSTALVCEIKPTKPVSRGRFIARQVVSMVDRLDAEEFVDSYISFDYDILLEIIKAEKSAKTQYLTGNKSPDQLKKDGITGLDYHIQVFKKHPEYISRAKALNLSLNVWTVNKPEDMEWFIDKNFDFITSDEPELLLEY